MCITSLPYCPPDLSQHIASLVYAAAALDARTQPTPPSSPLSASPSYSPISPQNPWFICEHSIIPAPLTTTKNPNKSTGKTNPANQTPPKTPQSYNAFATTPTTTTTTTTSSTMSTSPSTCPNIEIRHPSFNGATCIRCTDIARAAARGVTQEEKIQTEMLRKLEEEIARLEGVVRNMKRKVASLRRARGDGGGMGEHGHGGGDGDGDADQAAREGDLKAVLEGNLGRGWGGVL